MKKWLLLIAALPACIHQTVAYGSRPQLSNVGIFSYCGPNCLTVFLMMNGIPASLDEVARVAGRRRDGATMLGLKTAAEANGIYARGVRFRSLKNLASFGNSAIVLLKGDTQGQPGHYVLMTGFSEGNVKIVDPPRMPYLAPLSSMEARASGQALLLSTSPIQLPHRTGYYWLVSMAVAGALLVLLACRGIRRFNRKATS